MTDAERGILLGLALCVAGAVALRALTWFMLGPFTDYLIYGDWSR